MSYNDEDWEEIERFNDWDEHNEDIEEAMIKTTLVLLNDNTL